VILVVGEILFDIFPKSKRLGGAPFNFAYHLKNLGFPVRFISRIGMDDNGRKILDRIKAAGFDPDDIQLDDANPTGTVRVQLNGRGVPTFNIIPNVAYDYIQYLSKPHSKLLDSSMLLYFGTLVQRTDHGFRQIQRFLHRKQPDCISFYDINLRPNCYSAEVIQASLHNTNILKLNADELQECRHITGIDQNAPSFIRHMMSEYSLNIVAVTKGDDGSELYTIEGCSVAASAPVESMVDTVGAGDAYAAMLAAGLLKKWPPQKTLSMAAAFASRICAIKGAIPESSEFYETIRKQMRDGG
jgi:fructokinase